MNNTNETQGIHILTTSPSNKELNVNVNTNISIEFSSDIDVGSLVKNILVLQDTNRIFNSISDLQDYSKYSIVQGNISYNNKILTYTPNEPFNTDSIYIVLLNNDIIDITGNKLKQKYVFSFKTEETASYGPCEIISPIYGNICNSIPTFTWVNQKSPSYIFQISKTNTFETLILDKAIAGNTIDTNISYVPEVDFKEGIYHIRVKSENGEWSNVHQIFIRPITDDVVALEDTPILQNFDDFLDNVVEPIEVLEIFPSNESTNVSLKTNIFYIKMKGKVDESRIDFSNSYAYGEVLDDDSDEYDSHGVVSGVWTLIYDSYSDCTYLIYKLLEDTTEDEENSSDNTEINTDTSTDADTDTESNNNTEDTENNNENNNDNNSESTEIDNTDNIEDDENQEQEDGNNNTEDTTETIENQEET